MEEEGATKNICTEIEVNKLIYLVGTMTPRGLHHDMDYYNRF